MVVEVFEFFVPLMSGLSPIYINLFFRLVLENIILAEILISLFCVFRVGKANECECFLNLRVFLYQKTCNLNKYIG